MKKKFAHFPPRIFNQQNFERVCLDSSEAHMSDEEAVEQPEEGGEGGGDKAGDTHIPDIKITSVDSLNGSPVSKVRMILLQNINFM